MADDERLREALIELDMLRKREASRLRDTNALLGALESLTQAGGPRRGLAALLESVAQAYGCGLVVAFEAMPHGLVVRHASRDITTLQAEAPWEAAGLLTRNRRIVDLDHTGGLTRPRPPALSAYHAALVTPLLTEAGQRFALVCLDERPGAFSAPDLELLVRFGQFVTTGLDSLELAQRNAFLAAVIDGSPTSVAIADVSDPELPLIYVNEAFTALTGYDRRDVLHRNCRFLSAEPSDSPVRVALRGAVAKREAGDFVLRNRRADGTPFWNDLRLFPVRDDSGQPTHLVASQTDVTDRVMAERQRDAAQRRLEGALASTSEAFLVIDSAGCIAFVNSKFREVFGPSLDWRVGAEVSTAEAALLFDGAVTDGGPTALDLARDVSSRERLLPNGRHVLFSTRPMEDGGAVISAADITQVKMTEELLKQRVAAIETAQDGIAITDAGGRILHANPSLLTLWEQPRLARVLGRKWTAFYLGEDGLDLGAELASAALDGGPWQGERAIRLGEERRMHDLSLTQVPGVGAVLIVRDVTERLREAAERSDLRKELEEAQVHARLGQASAGLAHDFNNLLSAITGSAELILGDDDAPDAARSAAGRIREAAFRAADLVNALLDMGLRKRSSERLDLCRVVAATVDLARANAPAGSRVTVAVPDAPVWIEASRTDLLQVTMNLVVNGIDALDGGSGEVRLTLASVAEPDAKATLLAGLPQPGCRYAHMRVEDSGVGIPQDELKRILKPYYTTKGNAGSGLGLATVAEVLSAAGGMLTVRSAPGQGTTFDVYWPHERATPRAAEAPAPTRQAVAALPLMLVDDDAAVARGLAAGLEAEGFEVAETQDPAEALAAIVEDPDAWGGLVTDYDMGNMTGGDLVQELADIAPDLPIVVVSALARRLSDPRLSAPAVRAVLAKPVVASEVAKHLRPAAAPTDKED